MSLQVSAHCMTCPAEFKGSTPQSMREHVEQWAMNHVRDYPGHAIAYTRQGLITTPASERPRTPSCNGAGGGPKIDEDDLLKAIDAGLRTIIVGPSIDDLVKTTGLSRGSLHPRLRRLERRGIIEKTEIGWVRK